MADCTASTLTADARCLVQAMNDRQLLASIACLLAAQNDVACDPTTLMEQSKCLWVAMSERQLLASIAYSICNGGGGGGGLAFSTGTGSPEGVVSGSPGDTYWDTDGDFYYVKVTGSETTTGWQIH